MTTQIMLQAALIVASVGLAGFCFLLARRLRRLNDLESGLGGAIAVMAAEVDRLEKAIVAARDEAKAASETLAGQIIDARKEGAQWDLRRKFADAAPLPGTPTVQRKLRKRIEVQDA